MKRRPNILWRVFALGGIATLGALSYNDEAWKRWEEQVGDGLPRDAMRKLFNGTVVVHVGEALVAHRRARKAGLPGAGRWAFSTLLYGFPVMRRLSKATAAQAAGERSAAADLPAAA